MNHHKDIVPDGIHKFLRTYNNIELRKEPWPSTESFDDYYQAISRAVDADVKTLLPEIKPILEDGKIQKVTIFVFMGFKEGYYFRGQKAYAALEEKGNLMNLFTPKYTYWTHESKEDGTLMELPELPDVDKFTYQFSDAEGKEVQVNSSEMKQEGLFLMF